MKRLIELAEKIKDKKLREKTISLLKEQEISNGEMVYPKEDFAELPCWVGSHHNYPGGLLEHTLSVAKTALTLAENFEKIYRVKVNRDYLIAGALLHDIMKVFILRKEGKKWNFTGSLLDHAFWCGAELYARGFPEEVVHIVSSHGGDIGGAGAAPRTIEALLVFYADMTDSAIESHVHGVPQFQIVLMSEPQQQEKSEEE